MKTTKIQLSIIGVILIVCAFVMLIGCAGNKEPVRSTALPDTGPQLSGPAPRWEIFSQITNTIEPIKSETTFTVSIISNLWQRIYWFDYGTWHTSDYLMVSSIVDQTNIVHVQEANK